jgi:hypothetical protein
MSRIRLLILIDLKQRKKCFVRGGGTGGEIERDVKIGK